MRITPSESAEWVEPPRFTSRRVEGMIVTREIKESIESSSTFRWFFLPDPVREAEPRGTVAVWWGGRAQASPSAQLQGMARTAVAWAPCARPSASVSITSPVSPCSRLAVRIDAQLTSSSDFTA